MAAHARHPELLSENFGADRVLFGTGFKTHYGAAIAALAQANLSNEQRELIAHGNIERLLKLKPLQKEACTAACIDSNRYGMFFVKANRWKTSK